MISNQPNLIDGIDPVADALKTLGNRIKSLRIAAGHLNYEKFAYRNNIGRMLLRRAELGSNINYHSLLRIIKALDVSLADFFAEGFD
jgi:transcriptional regulator with XRE-family HTH domain